jgi:predicted nucleic acid-binding protein
MKILLDVNVLLDVVLGREPWRADAERLLAAVEKERAEGFVAPHTLATLHYVAARVAGKGAAAQAVADLLGIVRIVPLDTADFHRALGLGMRDFEDALQVVSGLRAGAEYVVTRDAKDFRGAPLPARTPGEILALL